MAPSPSGNSPLPELELSGESWIEKTYGKASSSVPNQGAQGDAIAAEGQLISIQCYPLPESDLADCK
ncbi:hypothetical protein L484_020024 [Morus notabilis]|uniref:Uncharacterized protein n=1 Tax=Morus notabilis TaxID=981085 RepID=W9SBR3_9ROSA|nr:hypothetical protein L484_020024 [Morus notabilis]